MVFYRLLDPELIQNRKITVVGGGDSAIESAMLLMEDNEVILSYRKDQFARIKVGNRIKIKAAEEAQKLRIIYSSNLKSIHEDHVIMSVKGEDVEYIENDLVYIFAGGELPTKFLQNAGVEITKRFGYIVKKHGA